MPLFSVPSLYRREQSSEPFNSIRASVFGPGIFRWSLLHHWVK